MRLICRRTSASSGGSTPPPRALKVVYWLRYARKSKAVDFHWLFDPSPGAAVTSSCTRESRATRRFLGIRSPRPGHWGTRRSNQSGFSLVESVVAVAVLAIILVPTIHIVLEGQVTSNEQRIEGEASTVATQAIQQLQDQVQQGIMPNGSTVQTVKAGSDVLTVRVTFTATSHGTSTTYCTTAAGGAPGTWIATASVTWHNMNGTPPLVETTELAPGVAGALDGSAGTLAVPIMNGSGQPFANASIPVTVTLTGTWTKGPGTATTQPAVPQGEIAGSPTPASVNTTTGCAVFLAVDPDPGWTYVVSINNSSNSATSGSGAELIDNSENSYDNPTQIPTIGPYVAQVGEPTLTSGFNVLQAAPVNVTFVTSPSSAVSPAAGIPVTVADPPSLTSHLFTSLASGGVMYLYPFATAYTAWAGDSTDSNPAVLCGAGNCYTNPLASTPASLGVSAGYVSSIRLPVYDLDLKQTGTSAGSQLTATDVTTPATAYVLNAPVSGTSNTGMPLGQYLLSGTGLTQTWYMWVTPAGVYWAHAKMTTLTGTLVALGTAVTVS